ncbi:MAG: carbohydrate ABC transporter permease [Phycisphaerales bacterium]|nr:carbohydrate ABC transporter permease [Phycisphaerales bacterium]
MASTAIKPASEANSGAIGLLPRLDDPAFGDAPYPAKLLTQVRSNLDAVLESPVADFRLYLRNSLLVGTLSVIGMVLSSAIVAYGFSRIRWPGRDRVFALVLATMMIPFTVIMAPQYLLFKHLGWIGTFLPLWAPAFFGGAFSIFLLRQFFMNIPRELDESARLDGCGHWGIFRHIILPLSRPALVVVALLQFIGSWNDFASPLIFLNHQRMYTASLGLQMYQTEQTSTPWNQVMMAAAIVVAPVLLVFLVAQRGLIRGIATQGLKD